MKNLKKNLPSPKQKKKINEKNLGTRKKKF